MVRVPLVLRCIYQGHKSAIFLDHLIQRGLHTDKNMADMASCLLLQVLPHCLHLSSAKNSSVVGSYVDVPNSYLQADQMDLI